MGAWRSGLTGHEDGRAASHRVRYPRRCAKVAGVGGGRERYLSEYDVILPPVRAATPLV